MVVPVVVLVVGATGILAPAVVALRARGVEVLGVARSGADLEADGTSGSFASMLPSTLSGALLYGPAVTWSAVEDVAGRSDGPVVHVLTSAASDPEVSLPPAPDGVRRLFLGWRPTDRTWHTPEEVSAAALAMYDSPTAPDVLGVVRPWSDRP